MKSQSFHFKQFVVNQEGSSMKVGTDGILLGAWSSVEESHLILDIGTGTGLIALMAAQRNSSAVIHGVEIDNLSYTQACENVSFSRWSNRIKIYNENIMHFDKDEKYDVILSNPPYFNHGIRSEKNRRAKARNSLHLPPENLVKAVLRLLRSGGSYSMIYPYQEGIEFIKFAKKCGLYLVKQTIVHSLPDRPPERLLMQFSTEVSPNIKDVLIIYSQDQNDKRYSSDFTSITKDFYI